MSGPKCSVNNMFLGQLQTRLKSQFNFELYINFSTTWCIYCSPFLGIIKVYLSIRRNWWTSLFNCTIGLQWLRLFELHKLVRNAYACKICRCKTFILLSEDLAVEFHGLKIFIFIFLFYCFIFFYYLSWVQLQVCMENNWFFLWRPVLNKWFPDCNGSLGMLLN